MVAGTTVIGELSLLYRLITFSLTFIIAKILVLQQNTQILLQLTPVPTKYMSHVANIVIQKLCL